MHVKVAPLNGSSSSNEENINVEDVPDAVTYVKPPSKKPFIIYNLLFRKIRGLQWNNLAKHFKICYTL